MRQSLLLLLAFLAVAGCKETPAANETKSTSDDASAISQKDELAQQKLTIEQAAEEATKLIEADAKAEIDAAAEAAAEPTP